MLKNENLKLFLLLFLPFFCQIPYFIFDLNSFSYGIVIVIIFTPIIYFFLGGNYKVTNIYNKFFLISLIFFTSIFFYTITLVEVSNFFKMSLTLLFLYLELICAYLIAKLIIDSRIANMEMAIKVIFYLLFIVFCVESIFSISENLTYYEKPKFPFKETSHFVIFFLPILFYYLSFGNRYFLYLLLLICFVFENNLTLLLSISFIAFIIYFRSKHFYFFIIFILLFFSLFSTDYFTSRLNIFDIESNLSILVYFQGLEFISTTLESNIYGVGFQQMGDQINDYSREIHYLTGNYLNIYDGSFLLSKLITELGFASFLILIPFIIYLLKCLYICLKFFCFNNKFTEHEKKLLFFSLISLPIIFDLFIRSVGYYSLNIFFLFIGISGFYLIKKNNESKKNNL